MTLSTNQVQFMISEPGKSWAYDYRPTKAGADELALQLELQTGKKYLVETFDIFDARTTAEILGRFNLAEILESFYYEMLNCLPPMHRAGAMGFFMCEYTSGTITSQFVSYRGKFYGASVDMANRETWITPEKIEALDPAEPLAWFPKEGQS